MAKNRRRFIQCPNCGHTLEEANNYCPNCGQENHNLNVPVKHLIHEFLEGTLHFDTKVWRSLKYLLLKPGLLTEKFNLGQRAAYVPPFRLYVFISLIFFTLLAFRSQSSLKVASKEDVQKTMQEVDTELQTLDSASFVSTENLSQQALANHKDNTFWNEFSTKFQKFSNNEHSKQKLLKNISFMMFVLMPFFGFILYLFYRSHGRNYVEHLMFSIHLHTFFFTAIILGLIVEYVFEDFDVDTWALRVSFVYLFFAMHRVYKQSYMRTFLKMIPITFLYFILLGVLFLSTIAVSVLLT